MKVIIVNNNGIINFNNVSYISLNMNNIIFSFNNSSGHVSGFGGDFGSYCLNFRCSKEEYQKIHKKIIDFLKDKDETILELNIN